LGIARSLNADELSTVRYLGAEVDDALEIAEKVDVRSAGAELELPCSARSLLGRVRANNGLLRRTPLRNR
jgi:hypothetical protein